MSELETRSDPGSSPEQHAGPVEGAPELRRDEHWQRLDRRMLLVHPIRELLRFLPVIFGLFLAGGGSRDGPPWQLLGVVVPVTLGILRYLTTSFRITGGRIELRRGLLSRHTLATPLERIRTVDLTSSLIQRVLGLTTLRVGTGTASTDSDEQLGLDGLPNDRARELRAELLRVTPAEGGPLAGVSVGDAEGEVTTDPVVDDRAVLRLDPTWARYAPLTSSGLVIAAAATGVVAQVINLSGGFEVSTEQVAQDAAQASLAVLIAIGVVGLLLGASVLSVVGYLVANWGFELRCTAVSQAVADRVGVTWHLRRGMFTTRETSLDDERVAGVRIGEPLGLRLVGAGRLSAIVTGLNGSEKTSALLTPPAPHPVVHGVAGEVLGTHGPTDCPLRSHGPAARRRRWVRTLVPALLVAGTGVLLVALGTSTWFLMLLLVLVPAAALAVDRSRSLGHALVENHLVARSGSIDRHRDVLAVEHVIGWNFSATWFQRRAGLTTLVATTAGGPQSVTVPDLPEQDAVGLATSAMPALLEQFRERSSSAG